MESAITCTAKAVGPRTMTIRGIAPTAGRSLGEAPGSDGAGQPYSQSRIEGRPDIPNYLIPAILVTILCCIPTGIVSIVYAAQVNGKIQADDIDGAIRTSKAAKTWAWVSFGLGVRDSCPLCLLRCGGVRDRILGRNTNEHGHNRVCPHPRLERHHILG